MKTSIFSRIFGAIVLVSFIAVTLVSTLNLTGQVQIFEDAVMREKKTLLSFIQSSSREEEGVLSKSMLDNVQKSENVNFLWVVDDSGEIYYSDNSSFIGQTIDDQFVGVETSKSRTAKYDGRRIKIAAKPLTQSRTVIMGVDMAQVNEFLVPAFARASVVLLIGVLISVFLSLALTERAITPLLQLRKAIKEISEGNLNQNISIETGDEIEEIGNEFNIMTEKLAKSRRELEESKKVLKIRVKARTKKLEKMTDTLEEKVEARTEELERKVEELEKFHKLTVGREKKMINLKEKNSKLKEEIDEMEKKIKELKS